AGTCGSRWLITLELWIARSFSESSASLLFARLMDDSKEQRPTEIEGWLGSDMLNPAPAFRTEPVEAQAVGRGFDLADQTGAQRYPLRRPVREQQNLFNAAVVLIEGCAALIEESGSQWTPRWREQDSNRRSRVTRPRLQGR